MGINYIRITIIFLLLISNKLAFNQNDCTVKLREAQKLFEDGKIEKVPDLIDNCIESGFNKENRIAALKLLTLVYLYEDKIEKAEETLLNLLKIDPEYKINRNVDPIEFIRLHAQYQTESVFSIGILLGGNIATPRLIETYSMYDFNKAAPDFKREGLGIELGVKLIYHYNNNLDIVLEPKYISNKYSITERVSDISTFTGIETKSYIEIPALAAYYFYDYRDFSFFADGGISYGMLLNSELTDPLTAFDNQENTDVKGSTIVTKDYRKNYLISGTAGLGIKLKNKRDNLQLNLRYNFGFNNLINEKVRNNYQENQELNDMIWKHNYQENDFSLSRFSFLISYNREFYIHRKKK